MDSQLYVWARKQEIEREQARRALVSEAKALPPQGDASAPRRGWKRFGRPRRDVMFGIKKHVKVAAPPTEGEMQRQPATSDLPAGAQQNGSGRAWRWQVEPGMEDAFQDLLGWMLPSQRGAEVETAGSPPEPKAPAAAEVNPVPEPQSKARATGERQAVSELRPLTA